MARRRKEEKEMMKGIKWFFTYDELEIAFLKAMGIVLAIFASPFIVLIIISWIIYGNPFN